jgi:hypothetical protein
LTLALRLTATAGSALQISIDAAELPTPQPQAVNGWEELKLTVPADQVAKTLPVRLRTTRGEVSVYHLWAAQ